MLAKTLERLGDRWALLVVRDLLNGPKRFTDLMDRLGGITPRTLTQRLRDLESDGLVLVDREPGRREVCWLNPETTPVRILLFLLMLGGLVLSTSIPKAFESRGLWFATAYAAMQVGRTIFLLGSIPQARPSTRMNAIRILVWLSM